MSNHEYAEDAIASQGPLTVGDLKPVLDKFSDDSKRVQVYVVDGGMNILPIEFTVVGLAENGEGELTVLAFPGTTEAWKSA